MASFNDDCLTFRGAIKEETITSVVDSAYPVENPIHLRIKSEGKKIRVSQKVIKWANTPEKIEDYIKRELFQRKIAMWSAVSRRKIRNLNPTDMTMLLKKLGKGVYSAEPTEFYVPVGVASLLIKLLTSRVGKESHVASHVLHMMIRTSYNLATDIVDNGLLLDLINAVPYCQGRVLMHLKSGICSLVMQSNVSPRLVPAIPILVSSLLSEQAIVVQRALSSLRLICRVFGCPINVVENNPTPSQPFHYAFKEQLLLADFPRIAVELLRCEIGVEWVLEMLRNLTFGDVVFSRALVEVGIIPETVKILSWNLSRETVIAFPQTMKKAVSMMGYIVDNDPSLKKICFEAGILPPLLWLLRPIKLNSGQQYYLNFLYRLAGFGGCMELCKPAIPILREIALDRGNLGGCGWMAFKLMRTIAGERSLGVSFNDYMNYVKSYK